MRGPRGVPSGAAARAASAQRRRARRRARAHGRCRSGPAPRSPIRRHELGARVRASTVEVAAQHDRSPAARRTRRRRPPRAGARRPGSRGRRASSSRGGSPPAAAAPPSRRTRTAWHTRRSLAQASRAHGPSPSHRACGAAERGRVEREHDVRGTVNPVADQDRVRLAGERRAEQSVVQPVTRGRAPPGTAAGRARALARPRRRRSSRSTCPSRLERPDGDLLKAGGRPGGRRSPAAPSPRERPAPRRVRVAVEEVPGPDEHGALLYDRRARRPRRPAGVHAAVRPRAGRRARRAVPRSSSSPRRFRFGEAPAARRLPAERASSTRSARGSSAARVCACRSRSLEHPSGMAWLGRRPRDVVHFSGSRPRARRYRPAAARARRASRRTTCSRAARAGKLTLWRRLLAPLRPRRRAQRARPRAARRARRRRIGCA